jgi:hypothetical protein
VTVVNRALAHWAPPGPGPSCDIFFPSLDGSHAAPEVNATGSLNFCLLGTLEEA